jgi:protein-S-isoprenylcysteine O-methyltransferase Ste14
MWLRIFLFAGLVLHKAIWEIWKRREDVNTVVRASRPPSSADEMSAPHSRTTSHFKRVIKLAKIALLIFFLIQTLFLNVLPMNNPNPSIRIMGMVLFAIGLCTAITGRVNLGRNWRDVEDGQILPDQMLVTQGIYSYIRHPIYAGDMLLIIGLELALQSWLVILALAIVAIVIHQSLAEEKMLVNFFPQYSQYCARTKRFLPFLI